VRIGDTFLRTDSDRHLWVVLSDPEKDPYHVLLVNMTTLTPLRERACVLNHGDHPWITHETCINYSDSDTVITTLELLLGAKDGGAIHLQDPLAAPVLRRILDGAVISARLSLEKAEILARQELIDI